MGGILTASGVASLLIAILLLAAAGWALRDRHHDESAVGRALVLAVGAVWAAAMSVSTAPAVSAVAVPIAAGAGAWPVRRTLRLAPVLLAASIVLPALTVSPAFHTASTVVRPVAESAASGAAPTLSHLYESTDEGESWRRIWTAPDLGCFPRQLVVREDRTVFVALDRVPSPAGDGFSTVEEFYDAQGGLYRGRRSPFGGVVFDREPKLRAVRDLAPTPGGGLLVAAGAYPPPGLFDPFLHSSDEDLPPFGILRLEGNTVRRWLPWVPDEGDFIAAVSVGPEGTVYGVCNEYGIAAPTGAPVRRFAPQAHEERCLPWPVGCSRAVFVDSEEGLLFAASENAGLLVSENDGRTWRAALSAMSCSRVASVACSEDGRTIFAAGTNGVWRSTNAGDAWRRVACRRFGPATQLEYESVAIDPADADHVLAGASNEVWIIESFDGGDTWHLREPPIGGAGEPVRHTPGSVTRIAFSHADPSIVYATTCNPHAMYCNELPLEHGGVWRSDDGGSSWRRARGEGAPPGGVTDIAVSRTDSAEVWCAWAGGLYRSRDAGESWHEVLAPKAPSEVFSVAVAPPDWSTVVAGARDGLIYLSRDRGAGWRTKMPCFEGAGVVHSIACLGESTIVASVQHHGVLRSTDAGESWQLAGSCSAWPELTGLSVVDGGRSVVLGTDGSGVTKCEFARVDEQGRAVDVPIHRVRLTAADGPPGGSGYDLAQSRDDPRVLCYADEFAGVFLSSDGGRRWSNVLDPSTARETAGHACPPTGFAAVHVEGGDPPRIWASAGWGCMVFASRDGGATWQAHTIDEELEPNPSRVESIAGDSSGALYAAVGVEYFSDPARASTSTGISQSAAPVALALLFVALLYTGVRERSANLDREWRWTIGLSAAASILVVLLWFFVGNGARAAREILAWAPVLILPAAVPQALRSIENPSPPYAGRTSRSRRNTGEQSLARPQELVSEIHRPAFFVGESSVVANRHASQLFGEDGTMDSALRSLLCEIAAGSRDGGSPDLPFVVKALDGRTFNVRFTNAPVATAGEHGHLVSVHKVDGSFIYNPGSLSGRECEIAELLVEGFTYREIADRLFIAPGTVRTHVHHIYEKTGATNRTSLAEILTGPT